MYWYFLEPLGVSVDKCSMGDRDRSRTYSFADIFGTCTNIFNSGHSASITNDPRGTLIATPLDRSQLIAAVNTTLGTLSSANDVPSFTDVQRIFGKSCIECHGGLDYPPYSHFYNFVGPVRERKSCCPGRSVGQVTQHCRDADQYHTCDKFSVSAYYRY